MTTSSKEKSRHPVQDRYGEPISIGSAVVVNDGGYLAKGVVTHLARATKNRWGIKVPGQSGRVLLQGKDKETKIRNIRGAIRIPD